MDDYEKIMGHITELISLLENSPISRVSEYPNLTDMVQDSRWYTLYLALRNVQD